mgnify:CR=1 FL=1
MYMWVAVSDDLKTPTVKAIIYLLQSKFFTSQVAHAAGAYLQFL